MKILIVENPRPLTMEHYNDVANAPLSASLNSGYALAIAGRAGWEGAYLDLSDCRDDEAVMAEMILSEQADMILIHWVYAWGNEHVLRNVLHILEKDRRSAIGAFGMFPSFAYRPLSDFAPQLDFILVGEFEATLDELLSNYSLKRNISSMPGLYRAGGELVRRELIADLSILPIPDDTGTNCRYPTMNIAAGRGCYGDCSFCFINRYYGCGRRRERSVASFLHELEERLKRRPVNSIYFVDPTFIGRDENQSGRVLEISSILKCKGLPFGFETRVDTIDEELIGKLAKNGASSVFLGIESGSEAALKRINKRISLNQIKGAVRAVQDSGIFLSVGFIMFEPDSTLSELVDNYRLLEELGLLKHHDQTVNMLYHSQIVLYGSGAWFRFAELGRLIQDERLPFEAGYRFLHADVARVCRAMRALSCEYFRLMDHLYRTQGIAGSDQFACCHARTPPGVDGDRLNLTLKESFLAFVRQAGRLGVKQFKNLELKFLDELRSCFPV